MKKIKLLLFSIFLLLFISMLNSCDSGSKDNGSTKFSNGIGITIRDKNDRPISNVEVNVNGKIYFSNYEGFVEITDTQSIRDEFRISISKSDYVPVELIANKYFFGQDRIVVLRSKYEETEAFSDSSETFADEESVIDSSEEFNIGEDQSDTTEVEEPTTPPRILIKPILNVNQTSIEIPVQKGTSSINVNNSGNGNLEWNARVSFGGTWLKLDGLNSGGNQGVLKFSYTTNYSTNNREGQILILASGSNTAGSPKTVTVKQAAYTNAQLLNIANENRANNIGFAIQIYKVITEADEEAYFNAQFELAKIYFGNKNYNDAITHFTHALNTNFQLHESEIYYNRGMAYYATDQLRYAIMDFEKAIRTFGSFTKAQDELLHYNWVTALVRLARVELDTEKKKNLISDAESIVNKYLDNFNGFNRSRTKDILEIKDELKKLNQ